jgi:hypothetical protein
MDLTNKQVLHKSFGKGNIVDCDDSYMVIHFSSGNKKFVYPDAFGEYLKLLDKKAAESIGKILQVQEVERKIEAEKIEKEKDKEFEEQLHTVRMEKLIKSHKIHLSSQVAFNCNNEELDGIFTEWNVFTGTIQSGANEGKPKKLIRIHQNSACLLTAKDAGMTEFIWWMKTLSAGYARMDISLLIQFTELSLMNRNPRKCFFGSIV